jgi:Xaa-Pro aminopeptidase
MSDAESVLIIAASEADANLYYASGFLAPDPFVLVEADGRKVLLMSDLEIDRARSQARVDDVQSYSVYEGKARQRWREPRMADVVAVFLDDLGVRAVTVPANFPLEHADRLREHGIRVRARRDPFFPARLVKRESEIAAIADTQRAVEAALAAALDVLRQSEARGAEVYWQGRPLISEDLKQIVNLALMERDCVGVHTIIACGVHGVDPHNEGSGPIRANQSIVFDIFPRSSRTRYFADMTRTVVKGRAGDQLRRMYDAVLAAQLRGIELVRDGASGQAIHAEVATTMEHRGFETAMVGGRNQGFFHGTGHGVGLDIHEPPRISKVDHTLKAGQVVTVEPGLYYAAWGAVRIEDMVVVEAGGCRNLTAFPKETLLEL